VFNSFGLIIGIVREQIESSAQLNIAISSNAIYEALELKTPDHPAGFNQGISKDLEMRTPGEIDADIAIANAERIEAEKKAKAAAGPTEAEKLQAEHDEQVRAENERALKSLPPKTDEGVSKTDDE
jgi:hypothetical protein